MELWFDCCLWMGLWKASALHLKWPHLCNGYINNTGTDPGQDSQWATGVPVVWHLLLKTTSFLVNFSSVASQWRPSLFALAAAGTVDGKVSDPELAKYFRVRNGLSVTPVQLCSAPRVRI